MANSLNDPLLTNASSTAAPAASAAPASNASSTTTSASSATSASASRERKKSQSEQIAETVQMVKDYARQETLDPVKTAGKWIGFGVLGATLIGFATAFLSLGLLRMVQTEWPGTFEGRWAKLAPYLFALLLCILVATLAYSRINKKPLTKEKR